jgi:hypothetical protein
MIQRDWTEQIDGLTNLARDQQGGIDVAGTDQVGLRQQPTRGEKAVNPCRHRPIRHSRRGGWTSVIRFGLSASQVSVR